MVKNKSETIRKGEPDDHEYAVKRVMMWLSDNFIQVGTLKKPYKTYSGNKEYFYPNEFRTHNDYPLRHRPDITLLSYEVDLGEDDKVIGFIEVDGKIGITYTGLDGKKHKSTPTRHDKPSQKKNDHIFEEYARRYHNVEVIRLLKEEILTDNKEDRESYLNKKLKSLKK